MDAIVFTGKAEAGKSLACSYLKESLEHRGKEVIKMAYGDYVKQTATQLFGWNGVKDEAGRHLLQWWGTDVVRKQDPDFWANAVVRLANFIKDDYDYLLIDDCRYPNEVACWGDTKGIVVRISRPGHENALTEEQRNHISETAMDNYPWDRHYSNATKSGVSKDMSALAEYLVNGGKTKHE